MFAQRFLRVSAVAVGASSIAYYQSKQLAAQQSVPFDQKGFPLETTPTTVSNKAQTLYLSGAGMRRKNLYVVEVDVYKVAVLLSSEAIKKGKEALASGKIVSDLVLDGPAVKAGDLIPAVAIPSVFVRAVTTTQVVEAFNDAFVGVDPAAVSEFKRILKETIGDSGMAKGDEVVYYWLKGGGLVIGKNGVTGAGVLRNKDVEKRLLDVYTDPARAVSPELVKTLQLYLTTV